MTQSIVDYCEAHGVGLDWLLYGSLKGLQRMMHDRKNPGPKQRWLEVCRTLTPEQRQIINEEVRRMLAARDREPA